MHITKSLKWFLIIFFFSCLLAFGASVGSARSFRTAKLPDKGKSFGCGTCHINPRGGGPRGFFGQDYEKFIRKSGDTYTPDLGAMDSDSDAFSNDKEFAAGTHPGNADSKP